MRPNTNLDLVEQDLADIRNILMNRGRRDDENRMATNDQHHLSKDEIKEAL